jgi:hypothetical protein
MSPLSEDELRAQLRDVTASPAPPAYAEHLIQQARLRRQRQRWVGALAAAAAVAVIGAGALVIGDRVGPDEALPAGPTPVPTASPSGTPSATTSAPTPTPSSSPSPSATPPRSPVQPVTFLHEGVKGDGETVSAWVAASHVTGPCESNAWLLAGRQGALERRAIRGGGGDGSPNGEALFVFDDSDSAVRFMGRLRELSTSCSATTNGATHGVVEELPGPWGEGVAFGHVSGLPMHGGGPVGLAVRSGRAVAMSSAAGPFVRSDEVNPGLVSSARPGVEHVFPQLCRYTQAGC